MLLWEHFVKNLTDTITQPSLVNLDYADLRAVMEPVASHPCGIGEGKWRGKVTKSRIPGHQHTTA